MCLHSSYEIYTHVCMYVCIYVCMSSIVGSFEAVSCETLPPQQLKVSESFLQQSEMFIASLLPSYPFVLIPLCIHFLFVFTLSSFCIDIRRFFTYGDMPLSQHLEQIERQALSKFERSSPSLEVPLEPRWSQPVSELGEALH